MTTLSLKCVCNKSGLNINHYDDAIKIYCGGCKRYARFSMILKNNKYLMKCVEMSDSIIYDVNVMKSYLYKIIFDLLMINYKYPIEISFNISKRIPNLKSFVRRVPDLKSHMKMHFGDFIMFGGNSVILASWTDFYVLLFSIYGDLGIPSDINKIILGFCYSLRYANISKNILNNANCNMNDCIYKKEWIMIKKNETYKGYADRWGVTGVTGFD
jgi:hypothetical protein